MKNYLIIVLFLGLPLSVVKAASFDCAKASTKIEHMICDNKDISRLDSQVAKLYKKGLAKSSNERLYRLQQVAWLKQERNICKDIACLYQAYTSRIDILGSNPHTITGTISYGYGEYGISDIMTSDDEGVSFMSKSEEAGMIFDKCTVSDVCQVTGVIKDGFLKSVIKVVNLGPIDKKQSVKNNPCKTKGWQNAYLKSITNEDGEVFHLNIGGSEVFASCASNKCYSMREGEYGVKIKVKLKMMTFGSADGDGEWKGCGITDIKR